MFKYIQLYRVIKLEVKTQIQNFYDDILDVAVEARKISRASIFVVTASTLGLIKNLLDL